jgi:cobalt-zinc-cadmium resistance protein CzcA
MRVEELISGVRATLALKIYGEDLDKLEELSAKLKGVVGGVPGVADLSAEANKGKPQMVIKVDRQAAARYGLNADDILAVVQAGHRRRGGVDADRRHAPLRHRGAAARGIPQQPSAIAAIPIRTAEGAIVPFLAAWRRSS